MIGVRHLAALLLLLGIAVVMPLIAIPQATYDTVVVFDITQSMDVEDYGGGAAGSAATSRIEYARQAARRILRDLPCGSRIGWAAFAEYRTILLLAPIEVCANYNDLVAALSRLDGRMRWGEASEITKGVYWAIRVAQSLEPHPDLVFLTDGQEAPPIAPDDAPALFDDFRHGLVHGWLVGVGSRDPQPIPRTTPDGRRVGTWHADEVMQVPGDPASHEELSYVREDHLKSLAQHVGFDYVHLDGEAALRQAILDPRHARRAPVLTDLSWVLVAAALLLLAWRLKPDVPLHGNWR